MTTSESTLPGWQRTLSRWIPFDVVVAWTTAAVAATGVLAGGDGFLRVALATPLLFFLPGYLLVATLFPQRDLPSIQGPTMFGEHDRVGLRERLALAFGLSVAVMPLLGLALAVSPYALATGPMVGTLLVYFVVVGLLAALRRRRLPEHVRFRLPVDRWHDEARAAFRDGHEIDRVLNVVLIAAVLLALGTVGYALAVPQDGQQFTDAAVLTDDGEELVASQYPDELLAGQSVELVTALENHEGQSQDYTVVATIERPPGADGDPAERELTRFSGTVADGERWTESHTVAPEMTGERLRLNYYVYRDGAPEEVGPDSAYRHLYVWVSVSGGTVV